MNNQTNQTTFIEVE